MENEQNVKQHNTLAIIAIVLSALSILISGFTLTMLLVSRGPKGAPDDHFRNNAIECPIQQPNTNNTIPNNQNDHGQNFNDSHDNNHNNSKMPGMRSSKIPSNSQNLPDNNQNDRPAVENPGPSNQNPFNF